MGNYRGVSEPVYKEKQTIQKELHETSIWKDFFSLIKVGIVHSNMITTFTGIWLALQFTNQGFLNNLHIVVYALFGSALIIAGSCSINNYFDRDIDRFMERTKERPTATGKILPSRALMVGTVFIIIGLISLLLTTYVAAIIGLIGVFSYIVLYTMWTKRRYVTNTIVGSISGAVPPLIGWAAIEPNLNLIAWSLFLLMFIWQPPHFYSLAMRRVDEYRAANIPMLPVVKGFERTKKSIIAWIVALFPIPFLLHDLGIVFVIIGTLLNIGWLSIGIFTYKKKDDKTWAKSMFIFSLQYMTIMFVSMVIVTFI